MDHFHIRYESNEARDDFQATCATKAGFIRSDYDRDSGVDKVLIAMFNQLGGDDEDSPVDFEK